MRSLAATFFKNLQDSITNRIDHLDGRSKFKSDLWQRQDSSGAHGGGGETRILTNGAIFEQAGVNFSQVHGLLDKEMSSKLVEKNIDLPFFACGISLVIHPFSPLVPTVHANFRYLEVEDKAWFGGGMDLTPYYIFEEDAQHFHRTLKNTCDKHDKGYYPKFKKWCDQYFYLPHRAEARGIGGIFFDYLGKDLTPNQSSIELPKIFEFVKSAGTSFLEAYSPIVERRAGIPFSEKEKSFQLLRRGRYVEFNLLYDRGTLFGLKTRGRTESILMSLPPIVHWSYDYTPIPESREAFLLDIVRNPKEWI